MRFRAGEALTAAGFGPDRVRAVLPRVDADRVWVRPAPAWFRAMWARGVSAIALPWGIYLHPDRMRASSTELGLLVVHELAHVDQWRRLGPVGWCRAYLGDYLRGRRAGHAHHEAYRSIGLEVEARDIARSFSG